MTMHNLEAEQGLLGSLLVDNRTYDLISAQLIPDHFYVPVHQRIYAVIRETIESGRRATPVTIKGRFEADEGLVDVGGASYLAQMAAATITTFNVPHYAETIIEDATRRRLADLAASLDVAARDRDTPPQDTLAGVESELTAITGRAHAASCSAGDAAQAAMEWMEGMAKGTIRSIRTGIEGLDDAIGGFYAGRLYILAGRPGMGKTALALTMADNIATTSPVLFVSLEMAAQELAMRLIAARTNISVQEQEDPRDWHRSRWEQVNEARQQIGKLNLTIEDAYATNLSAIRSLARRHRRKHGGFVLFIDYLGLMGMDANVKQRVHQIEEITKGLKSLSKELDIPVVLLSQLSRAVESREDKRPMLSDLRDSGSIEQDADCVMFAYREEYYARAEEPKRTGKETADGFGERYIEWQNRMTDIRGKADVIVAKIRQRRTGTVHLNFDGIRQRFE